MPRDIFDIFQWMPWYFPLNAARYFRCVFRKICTFTWKINASLIKNKNAHFFNALFWINFHWGAQNGWKSWKNMFYVFCLFTPLYRRFRLSRVSQTIDLDEIYRFVSKILNFMPCGSVFGRFCVLWKNISESPYKIYLKSM